jgi:hypothetical protein
MKGKLFFIAGLALIMALTFGTSTVGAAENPTKCFIKFNLKGWSVIYETMSGTGTITCNNGQSAKVKLSMKGGGLTAGVSRLHGKGEFTEVYNIRELYGSYARGGAHAGVVGSASAQVVSKGGISLALEATGRGLDLGWSLGNLSITPIGSKKRK